MVQEKRREREREIFWVDRKTCKKKRISTDPYYNYDEIDYKINACLKTACKLYIKRYSKKYAFIFLPNVLKTAQKSRHKIATALKNGAIFSCVTVTS